ncbi:MAG: c-type cytochrome, partial [Polyangia bacterium]
MAKIDEQISYNWLFFLLAGAFGAVTFWAVYDETATRREYKTYQEAFFKIETDLASKNLAEEKAKLEKNTDYQKAVAEKKQLDAELAGPKRQAYEEAKAKLQQLTFVAFDKQQNAAFTKSLMDESYYYYTKAKHEVASDPSMKGEFEKREKTLKSYQDELVKLQAIADVAAAKKKAQEEIVDAFTNRITALGKQIDKFETDEKGAERKYAATSAKQTGLFGPDTEIVQENLENIDRVDRCESCHMGSNRGGFETVQPAYFQSHPYRRTLFALHPIDKFGCTTCHDGQGRATTKFYAHAPDDKPHEHEKHFWDEPLLKGPFMESNCRKCHKQEYDLRSFLKCETTSECPQSPIALKCDVPAQPLNPSDTSIDNFLPPEPAKAGEKVAEASKYCVDPDSGNAKLVDLAPHLDKGRKVIEEAACYGCHPIEGYNKKPKTGPDLRHAASKLNPAWMVQWIRNPKAIHKFTRMPNFFPEEVDPQDYPKAALPVREDKSKNPDEPWKWTLDEQTQVLTSFLLSQSTPYKLDKAPPGDAANGRQLFLTLGCRGCHNITYDKKDPTYIEHKNRASHYDHGPMLGDLGSKTNPDWIFTWLRDPKSYAPGTRMPNLRLSVQEAADLAAFLASGKSKHAFPTPSEVKPDDKEWVASGKKL